MKDPALTLLRARFPESEGWLIHFIAPPHFNDREYAVVVLPGRRVPEEAVRIEGECMPTKLLAAKSLIEVWDAATGLAKVRELVRAANGALRHIDPTPGPWTKGGRAITSLVEALAALPAHWRKEAPDDH